MFLFQKQYTKMQYGMFYLGIKTTCASCMGKEAFLSSKCFAHADEKPLWYLTTSKLKQFPHVTINHHHSYSEKVSSIWWIITWLISAKRAYQKQVQNYNKIYTIKCLCTSIINVRKLSLISMSLNNLYVSSLDVHQCNELFFLYSLVFLLYHG